MTLRNPVIAGAPGDDHGDPFVIRYLDSYFLYHTGDTSGRRGVSVHRSDDLVHWEFRGYALEAASSGWAWSDLWAPEVVYERGMFYMYVSATRALTGRRTGRWQTGAGDDAGRRLGLARARNPEGPFVWDDEPLLDHWSIDGHPFRDDDGSFWLFYNVRNEHTAYRDGTPGTGIVCDRLLGADRLEGRPRPVVSPSQDWEGNRERDFYWNEAPFVLPRRGMYHLMYSGGYFRDDTYAIGLARWSRGDDAWLKRTDNPILVGSPRIRGPGHHSLVFGPDAATRYAVYHGYVEGAAGRKVCLDRLRWGGDRPVIDGPTDEQPAPPPAVFDADVPHWAAELWARGSWVEVCGRRFPLDPADVWHQVECEQTENRLSVRVGGILRGSRPVESGTGRPSFDAEGALGPLTLTSCGVDAALHGLPRGSTYAWAWGGRGPVEVSVAVRGAATVRIGAATAASAESDAFAVLRLAGADGGDEIVVEAVDGGASVADLAVFARPT
ncbi:MAG: glycoside hydrolase family 43 protein [Gaiellaceae bacterium]